VARLDGVGQQSDRLGLIARGFEIAFEFKKHPLPFIFKFIIL
jgi:hypothetical protein